MAPVHGAADGFRAERPARPELSPQQLTRTVAEAGALPEALLAGLGGPDACVFATRCAFAAAPCAAQPPLGPAGDRRSVACHRHAEWMTLARDRAAGRTTGHTAGRSTGRTTEGQLA